MPDLLQWICDEVNVQIDDLPPEGNQGNNLFQKVQHTHVRAKPGVPVHNLVFASVGVS